MKARGSRGRVARASSGAGRGARGHGRGLPFAALVLAFGPVAAAQMPPGKWWKDPSFQADLGLDGKQQAEIEALFAAQRDRFIDLRAELQKREEALHDAFDAEPFDEARARTAAEAMEKARGELSRTEMGLQIGIRKVLSGDQFARLRRRLPHPPPGAPHAPNPPLPNPPRPPGPQGRPGGPMAPPADPPRAPLGPAR